MSNACHSARGFTLVELLVVIMIMGVIGSVVIACFAGGMRAYERVYDFGSSEADAYLAGEFVERDLKNAVKLPGVPFQGQGSVMQFPALRYRTAEDAAADDVVLVRYWYDARNGLQRSEAPLRDGDFSTDGDSIARPGIAVSFFYGGDSVELGSEWQSTTNLPRQVRISFVPAKSDGVPIEQTVRLPVAGGAGDEQ